VVHLAGRWNRDGDRVTTVDQDHSVRSQQIELILMRQLAGYLSLPIFIVDMNGDLLYYNEPAAKLIGRPFDEAGAMAIADLVTTFHATTEDGSPLTTDHLPVTKALRDRRPAYARVRYRSLDGVARMIDITAFPLDGHGGRHVGVVAIFWEATEP
jgi:PAS domain-containing protein